jgi:hypothetical protein
VVKGTESEVVGGGRGGTEEWLTAGVLMGAATTGASAGAARAGEESGNRV